MVEKTTAFAIMIMLSLTIESIQYPDTKSRSAMAYFIHINAQLFIFLLMLTLTHRFYSSLVITFSLQCLLLYVTSCKHRILKEHVVFSDLFLYLQVFRFPRFYLPFVRKDILFGGLIGILTTIFVVFNAEPALPFLSHHPYKSTLMLIVLTSLVFLLSQKLSHYLSLTLKPNYDTEHHGILSTTTVHLHGEIVQKRIPQVLTSPAIRKLKQKAPIIAIQSEAFFDIRRLSPDINPIVLENFDLIRREALLEGQCTTPAWGAYTMRSEFSFLTGIANEDLAYGRFDPLRFFKNYKLVTLMHRLKQQGYRCICIHPNSKSFFERNKIYPRLGFDEFIDIESFAGAHSESPFICDMAVTDRIIEETNRASQPVFIFVITIENHGPYHLENITQEEIAKYMAPNLPHKNLLSIYLRHLKNADRMIQRLREFLMDKHPDGLMVWYGDHVPAFPKIFNTYQYENPRTDYFIWQANQRPDCYNQKMLDVHDLLLESLNFVSAKKIKKRKRSKAPNFSSV